ncbi:hypothetical protein [Pelagibius sp. Alg239-R121]|uniref:hypothetical protein n=1 Tax=Pelagibius sp. Alg239-R121 TaxID=2993448 RepID=UPI0024A66857|nr:hypothetical protein [Pelagibius sp. Alg239-R121]
MTRPGAVTELQFPVIETGEVDGLILLRTGPAGEKGSIDADFDFTGNEAGTGEPGTGLRVLLIDDDGKVVAETVSAYDGFFFISPVPYGRYHLMLDEKQLRELGYSSGPTRRFEIREDEPVAAGLDLIALTPL